MILKPVCFASFLNLNWFFPNFVTCRLLFMYFSIICDQLAVNQNAVINLMTERREQDSDIVNV